MNNVHHTNVKIFIITAVNKKYINALKKKKKRLDRIIVGF